VDPRACLVAVEEEKNVLPLSEREPRPLTIATANELTQLIQRVKLPTYIPEVPDSNVGQNTSNPDLRFFVVSPKENFGLNNSN
jgi:hypothetical protein